MSGGEIKMKSVLVGACLVAVVGSGCSTVAGPAGERGPQGEPGPAGPAGDAVQVAALASRVAMLEAQVAAAAKVPHLVVEETGEDLGRMLDWQTAWNEQLGAPVRVMSVGLVFSLPECKGEARLLPALITYKYAVTALGDVVDIMSAFATPFTAQSQMELSRGCQNTKSVDNYATFAPTGIKMPTARLLHVEMR